MVDPDKFGEDPIGQGDYKRGVLRVWIYSVGKVGGVPCVPDVIYDSQDPRYVESDRIGVG